MPTTCSSTPGSVPLTIHRTTPKPKFCAGNRAIGSVSHDNLIRLWDASILFDEGDSESDEDDAKVENQQTIHTVPSCAKGSGVDSEDDWDDASMEDSDSGDEGGKKGKKQFKTENEKFFEDL